MGPVASLAGRDLGMDFTIRDGFRMYHGSVVPGFPAHPHRGFETITLARQGYIDHSDSLGARARFGRGDVQWMTAGKGIVHAEMFPLVRRDEPNPTELFQIWLNLPRRHKMVEPHFAMLWAPTIPRSVVEDGSGGQVVQTHITGAPNTPAPPPKSWAADPEAHVAVWTLELSAHARCELPAVPDGVLRTLYFFRGDRIEVDGRPLSEHLALEFDGSAPITLQAGESPCELLLLQGRPIREPVAHHGPFVMNEPRELMEAMYDYQRTRFGGWPWPDEEPVHDRDTGRFAQHADGRIERPD